MKGLLPIRLLVAWALLCSCGGAQTSTAADAQDNHAVLREYNKLELALQDLAKTFPGQYPNGPAFLSRLKSLRKGLLAGELQARSQFQSLRREALLQNPLLASRELLVIRRKPNDPKSRITAEGRQIGYSAGPGREIGMPSNHECNSSLEREGYDNEICVLSPIGPEGNLCTLYRPDNTGYVGEIDLHWDGNRLLFTRSDATNWKIFEMQRDGSALRQVSRMPDDVDSFDPCYLPNGKIIFGSTASFQSVPCWHGRKRVSNLYVMNGDGSGVRQLCFDQDHNFHPTVLPDGQVLYHRWDYTGINHIYLRELMLMNPDGTRQRAIYGSSSWYPNSLYFPRPLPDDSSRIACILSGYHGAHRIGQFVLLDVNKGWQEAEGITLRISGRGDPVKPIVKDNLVDADWPKFLHPEPLNDKYFLVAARLNPKGQWGIYIADVFDNLELIREEPGYALIEPVLLQIRPTPPVLAEHVQPSKPLATVYLHNVYAGPGLAGVPKGTVQKLRVIAYDFGYPGLAGPDMVGYGGPWEVMRILGTVPLEEDGSAMFNIPADTPVALQPIDKNGQAVQLMRSWFSARRGEKISCVGCHERTSDAGTASPTLAAAAAPRELTPWHGPARGFDFEREVQPVLDRLCISCHDGTSEKPDLRPTALVTNYTGLRISDLGIQRLHPSIFAENKGLFKYSPAYDSLIHYIRRVGIEDDVRILAAGEYQADTSPLIQMLRRGHHDVQLAQEDWERLFTWIDLNGPCHGTWNDVHAVPDGMHERRMELRKQFGGPADDPEVVLTAYHPPASLPQRRVVQDEISNSSRATGLSAGDDCVQQKVFDLGGGVQLKMVLIPAQREDGSGESRAFWMGTCEISNEQFRRFAASHDPGYYTRRHAASDDMGLWLNEPLQPVVRVSWDEAVAFCEWLSKTTGEKFTLPTEAQWEWACRAGTTGDWSCDGEALARHANIADLSFSRGLVKDGKQSTGGLDHMVLEGAKLSDASLDDTHVVTAPLGSYQPNGWGLYDMHGNAAEWTATVRSGSDGDRRVVRGGSFFDPPKRCTASASVDYPKWRRVFNVGFRVVTE